MGKKSKTGKARKDKFYFLAKQSGYRARAAFKLIQLNRKFGFLSSAKVLVDLCAAPGSWCQVAVKEMPVSSLVVGVDLVPIQAIPGVKTIQADITTEKCRQLLKKELTTWKADVVLHDGAPNVGTAWGLDEFQQAQLCLKSFALATELLRRGGTFVTKVFRSKDYEPLKWVLDHFFRSVKAMKPEASRLESAEIYLVCQRYTAPDRIDPKFLDIHHVFKDVEDPATAVKSQLVNLYKPEKRKRKAVGYAENDSLFNKLTVSNFLHSEDYLQLLAAANLLEFDINEVENHPLTTAEIKEFAADLKLLAKPDIKALLKWRQKIIKELFSKNEDSDRKEQPIEKPEEEQINDDIQRLIHEEKKEIKKKQKKVRENKRKLTERIQMKMVHPGDYIEQSDDVDIFSLAKIKSLKATNESVDVAQLDEHMEEDSPPEQKTKTSYYEKDDVPTDAQWDTQAKDSDADSNDPFCSDDEMSVDSDAEQNLELSEEDDEVGENPLLVDLEHPDKMSRDQRRLEAWYEKTAFKDILEDDDSDSSDEARKSSKSIPKSDSSSDGDDDDEQFISKKEKKRLKNHVVQLNKQKTTSCESSTKQSHTQNDGPPVKKQKKQKLTPEERALAVKMIRSAKSRRELEEWGYNRYVFEDHDLPSWFAEDEKKHMKKSLPLTRSEVSTQKPQDINTRTSKKVEEAKARKKMKQTNKLKKIRKKAEALPDELSEKERWAQIKQMYSKAGLLNKKQRPVTYIVNNKAGGRQVGATKRGAKIKVVDRRLKADLRSRRAQEKVSKRGRPSRRGGKR